MVLKISPRRRWVCRLLDLTRLVCKPCYHWPLCLMSPFLARVFSLPKDRLRVVLVYFPHLSLLAQSAPSLVSCIKHQIFSRSCELQQSFIAKHFKNYVPRLCVHCEDTEHWNSAGPGECPIHMNTSYQSVQLEHCLIRTRCCP